MSTAPSSEMETLKSRLKTTWEAGDFSQIARHIETAAEDFIGRLDVRPGMKVLDVACGNGNLAVVAARNGADVTGIDIADNLVESAKQRAAELGLNIKFEQGDAEALPYDDDSFDAVMTMYGAMFAPRPEVTASELVRVCKPGGTVAMANWTPGGFAGKMFKVAGKYLPPPDMPSPVMWGVPDTVRERFGDRLTDLRTTPRMARFEYDFPPAKVVELFKTYFGPTVMAFKAIAPENREAYRADLEALWTENNVADDADKTHIDSEYLEVIGTKR